MKLVLPSKLFGRIKKPIVHPNHARFRAVMRVNLTLPPLVYDVDSQFPFAIPPRMWHNDVEGDCVIAARANQQTRFFAGLLGELKVISDDEVQSEYISETGGPDTGLVPDDSLSLWKNRGWSSAGKQYSIAAWARVNASDRLEVQHCIHLLCGMQLSLPLPNIWNDALQRGLPWDVPSPEQSSNDDSQLDSWGGHQVYVKGYDERGVICLTWGQEQLITWEALAWAGLESNGGEAEGIVRFNDSCTTPTDHIDVAALLSDLAVIEEAQ